MVCFHKPGHITSQRDAHFSLKFWIDCLVSQNDIPLHLKLVLSQRQIQRHSIFLHHKCSPQNNNTSQWTHRAPGVVTWVQEWEQQPRLQWSNSNVTSAGNPWVLESTSDFTDLKWKCSPLILIPKKILTQIFSFADLINECELRPNTGSFLYLEMRHWEYLCNWKFMFTKKKKIQLNSKFFWNYSLYIREIFWTRYTKIFFLAIAFYIYLLVY